MPNYVTNEIRVIAPDVATRVAVALRVMSAYGLFDFNRIVPMPTELRKHGSYLGTSSYYWALDNWDTKWNAMDVRAEEVDFKGWRRWQDRRNYLFRVSKKQLKRHLRNDGELVYRFDTAWSHPSAVINQLIEMFPTVDWDIAFADEDLGSNCGFVKIRSGEVTEQDEAGNRQEMSKERQRYWRGFAFKLVHTGADPADWDMDENFEYV